jgi:hypothetical protein
LPCGCAGICAAFDDGESPALSSTCRSAHQHFVFFTDG